MIHISSDFVSDLPSMKVVCESLQYKRRSNAHHASYEAWYPEPNDISDKINYLAAIYARDYLNASADAPTAILATCYEEGHRCEDHIDQYFNREGASDTGNRTVSVSIIVESAIRGGEMILQDFKRREPPVITNIPAGHAIFFPADWWHRVEPVKSGVRRSIVQWYADSTCNSYKSWGGD